MRLRTAMSDYFSKQFHKRAPTGNPQCLNANQVYILPSYFGLAFAFVLLSIGVGAINYQMNSAFFLVFLLMVIGLMSMWESQRNLKGLSIRCLSIEDTEAGQPAKITLALSSQTGARYGLLFAFDKGDTIKLEILPEHGCQISLPLPTSHRGEFTLPRIIVETFFPLGFFHVWSYLYFDEKYYVYPRAINPGFWPKSSRHIDQKSLQQIPGDEELYELKSVENPWLQPGKIAWKASSKNNEWFQKSMTSPTAENWIFSLHDLITVDSKEDKLCHLSYWVQQAEAKGHSYGLNLDNKTTRIGQGKRQQSLCLRQLAIYQEPT